jgi:magnesium-transporting ATPase (P-type)
MYFLVMGFIMAIGWYTPAFESAINPWTLLGPLALVVSFSLTQEALADIRRHQSDDVTNNCECVVLRRAGELDNEGGIRESTVRGGKDVEVNLEKWRYAETTFPRTPMGSNDARCNVAFQAVKRKDIRQGQIVMIRNRDMVPADLILLASSAENGVAYIETMSIDGETNLKLRTSPRLPENVAKKLHQSSERNFSNFEEKKILIETLEQATARICRLTSLGFHDAVSSLDNPSNRQEAAEDTHPSPGHVLHLVGTGVHVLGEIKRKSFSGQSSLSASGDFSPHCKYITALKCEPPNASVNTFNGVLWLPPLDEKGGASIEIPLNGENMLLRGAVLRNTEWAMGIACYTGKDTKLVRNSFETPSKFSRLDQLTNSVVYGVLGVMVLCIIGLATFSSYTYNEDFPNLWYDHHELVFLSTELACN